MISTRSSMLSWSIRKIWVAVEHRTGQHRRIRHDTPYVPQQKERSCTTDVVQDLSEELDPVPPRTNCLPYPTSTSMCLGSRTVNNRHGQRTGLCRMTGAREVGALVRPTWLLFRVRTENNPVPPAGFAPG